MMALVMATAACSGGDSPTLPASGIAGVMTTLGRGDFKPTRYTAELTVRGTICIQHHVGQRKHLERLLHMGRVGQHAHAH